MAELLLHQFGPAVLKAVRKVEKAQGGGAHVSSSSSSSSSSVQPGGAAMPSDAALVDELMTSFGRLMVQHIFMGKQRLGQWIGSEVV
jgi:hypothetical protein